jgi:hypothetical protein
LGLAALEGATNTFEEVDEIAIALENAFGFREKDTNSSEN